MRYYDIVITDPDNGGAVVKRYTSFLNGQTLPSALDIEVDVFSFVYASPGGGSFVRVWGIPLSDISISQNLVGMDITVSAGMQKGLPLATPAQAGVILQGRVYQMLGNWIGTDMTLDIFATPHTGTVDVPANIVFSCPKGTPLASAVFSTLRVAFPGFTTSVTINENLTVPYDLNAYYRTLTEFAQWLKQKSIDILGGTYPGVDITVIQNRIAVYDNTAAPPTKTVSFNDLIGQPTWIAPLTIQFKTVMRADISVSNLVTLPATLATATPQSLVGTQQRNKLSFSGQYLIQLVRHVGSFRQPTADAWVSIFEATPLLSPS